MAHGLIHVCSQHSTTVMKIEGENRKKGGLDTHGILEHETKRDVNQERGDMKTERELTQCKQRIALDPRLKQIEEGLSLFEVNFVEEEPYTNAEQFALKFKRCTLYKDANLVYSSTTSLAGE